MARFADFRPEALAVASADEDTVFGLFAEDGVGMDYYSVLAAAGERMRENYRAKGWDDLIAAPGDPNLLLKFELEA
jgi:hypothetical protein